jgi:hypothetical protein
MANTSPQVKPLTTHIPLYRNPRLGWAALIALGVGCGVATTFIVKEKAGQGPCAYAGLAKLSGVSCQPSTSKP